MKDQLLVRAAYFEWRVAKAYSTGTTIEIEPIPCRGPRHPMLSNSYPSGKFVREELGYSFDHGPSLSWICSQLERLNRNACKMLGDEAPWKYDWPVRRAS